MKYTLQVKKKINVPASKIYQTIIDFSNFSYWDPWLLSEPQAETSFSNTDSGIGSSFSWKGKIIGEGALTTTALIENEYVEQELRFISPWKTTARTYYNIISISENSTEISWGFEGNLPFFMFFMKSKMIHMLTQDFTLGLDMLSAHLDEKDPNFTIDLGAVKEKPELHYVAVNFEGMFDVFMEKIEGLFQSLAESCVEQQISFTRMGIIYKYVKMTKSGMYFKVDVFAELDAPINSDEVSAPLYVGILPAGTAYSCIYQGPYNHIPQQYSFTFSQIKMLKYKLDKRNYHGAEIYLNSPQKVSNPSELKTEIFIPILSTK